MKSMIAAYPLFLSFSAVGCDWIANRIVVKKGDIGADDHFHSFPELHYIQKGEVEFTIDFAEKITLSAGQLLLIGSHHHHEERTLHSMEGYSIELLPQHGAAGSQGASLARTLYCYRDVEEISFYAEQLVKYTPENEGSQECQKALLSLLLWQMAEKTPLLHQNKEQIMASIEIDEFFNRILDFPEAPCLPEMLAGSLHMSVRQLNRRIHAVYGMSFSEKRTETRLRYVERELLHTDKSIEQISESLNMTTNYLIRLFHQRYGITPLKYRKINKR